MNAQKALGRIPLLLAKDRNGSLAPSEILHDLAVRAANHVMLLKILRGVTVDRADPRYLACPEPLRPAFLGEDHLRELARSPENELTDGFLDEALAKGDACYAILDGDVLAAYGWYSCRPTRIDPPELTLCFGDRYVYMYKGFTHKRYRGRRLHAIGMTRALQHYLDHGYKGIVSYVESNNYSSLRSVFRMGYVWFGSIWVVGVLGSYATIATAGCQDFEFRLEPTSIPAAGPAAV